MCASPQKENGYTPIAHSILEALSKQVISSDEWRILIVIFRKTYGWDKKEDCISLGQFSEATGIKRAHIPRIIRRLLSRNIIIRGVPRSGNSVTRSGNTLNITYGLQKDFDSWRVFPKQGTVPQPGNRGVPQSGKKVFPNQGPTKDNIQKKLTKERDMCDFICFWNSYPKKAGKKEAMAKWFKLTKDKIIPPIGTLLEAVHKQKESDQWSKDNGKYIPKPTTWLNGERWNDELLPRQDRINPPYTTRENPFINCPKCGKETTKDDLRKFDSCPGCFKPPSPEKIKELLSGIK